MVTVITRRRAPPKYIWPQRENLRRILLISFRGTVVRHRVATRQAKQRWRFALYIETPSERPDGQWFHALYFRDEDRSKFGKLEFIGQLERRDFRSIATKIEKDEGYRRRFLSDDPELPRLWRKR